MQVSLGRKLVYYLRQKASTASVKRHGRAVDRWMEALSKQLHGTLPTPRRAYVPKWKDVAQWARQLAKEAIDEVERELKESGSISVETARLVHDALLICLVAGTMSPPLRLWILKTLAPPEFALNHGCQDPDCRHRATASGCLGNTFEVIPVEDIGKLLN